MSLVYALSGYWPLDLFAPGHPASAHRCPWFVGMSGAGNVAWVALLFLWSASASPPTSCGWRQLGLLLRQLPLVTVWFSWKPQWAFCNARLILGLISYEWISLTFLLFDFSSLGVNDFRSDQHWFPRAEGNPISLDWITRSIWATMNGPSK